MIDAIIYRAGIIRRSWRIRLVAANGRKFGHHYNDKDNAVKAARDLFDETAPVRLLVENEHTGQLEHKGLLR